MTDLAVIDHYQRRAPANQEKPLKVAPKMRRALDLMVWDNKTDNEAAVQIGITVTAIRLALKQTHVRAYYRDQLQVLRERESSRNIHTLVDVRDGSNQMARVAAVKALEQFSEETLGRSGASPGSPGLTIMIVNGAAPSVSPITIDTQLTQQPKQIEET